MISSNGKMDKWVVTTSYYVYLYLILGDKKSLKIID